jgi:DNA helicase II / ATP-dependent DNA helicase PcrA
MELTKKQLEIMGAHGHLLVTGGPGSGKTTVSILKAAKIAERDLRPGQKILFLSFARATVSRVVEAIEYEQQIPREQKQRIEVETYHSFFWRILKAHGYLIGLPRRLFILTPSNVGIALSVIRGGYASKAKLSDAEKADKLVKEDAERVRLAREEGQVCFDLFAHYAGDILDGSKRVRTLIATMYPVIILDEFQDTNSEQWRVVHALGEQIVLHALADPEQRIYDWLGADPERLNHFEAAFSPKRVDLSSENHRSKGTDIALFGNDILKGKFRKEPYVGVEKRGYPPNENEAYSCLVIATYSARKRLVDSAKEKWSLAVLVPTKKMTRLVSDVFRVPPAKMKEIHHTAAIEMEGAILSAEVVAFLLQPDTDGRHFGQFIALICNYFHGRGGADLTKGDLKEAECIRKACDEWTVRMSVGKPIRQNSILVNILAVHTATRTHVLTGDPGQDWLTVRRMLETSACTRLREIAEDARDVRLLERGMHLRQELSQDWRDNGSYLNALSIVRQAFVQEHFSTNAKPENGVVVMNMHKAKGKQFDEVIIFEGWPRRVKGKIVANPDRIVQSNLLHNIDAQSRQNFRVSVTRAKTRTTILTPTNDPCVLLLG